MKRSFFSFLFFSVLVFGYAAGNEVEIVSPDKSIKTIINIDDGIRFTFSVDHRTIIRNSKIGLVLSTDSGKDLKVKKVTNSTISENIDAPFYKVPHFSVTYNLCKILLANNLCLEFRVFNDGMAYRFTTTGMKNKEYFVYNEIEELHFTEDFLSYIPFSTNKRKPEAMAFQATYDVAKLSQQDSDNLAFLPLTVACGSSSNPDLKITIMESDLESYPGMFMQTDGSSVNGVFAKYPKSFEYYSWRMQKYVKEKEDYIAKCYGDRQFPWRVFTVSRKDIEMPLNHLVYALATPNKIGDTSWIKPGKVAWDWWNDWGITGVDFKAGINTETYKHYIDFAADYGLNYIILDEGWYDPKSGNMLSVIDDLDLSSLIEHANQKNVKIILWTVFNVLDKNLDLICKKYSDMGIAGFKVDFLDRDDQEAVEMIYRIADVCARYHLLLDYHGIYKPTGLNRTYPNVINFESVFGMEEAKWTKHDEKDMPLYDVTFPFIRMQCGSVDFTPGGMRNATAKDFQPVYANPMTMGTRCHQLAMYVVHDSPLTMLADNPTSYMREPEFTRFMAQIPTIFDNTVILDGKLGEFIVTARKSGTDWYLAGQTNWSERDITLDLSQLGTPTLYNAIIYSDGMNADKNASDYQVIQKTINTATPFKIHMASGGGFVCKLSVN